MPAHSTQVTVTLDKNQAGFTVDDATTYPTGSNNHLIDAWRFWLIVIVDPTGTKYLMSSHDFLAETYNAIQPPGIFTPPPLKVLKSDSGVGRYEVEVFGAPQLDTGGVEDNYGLDDVFGVENADGTISFYRVLTDVTPSTDTNLADGTKYSQIASITDVTSRYKAGVNAFLVMNEWIDCYNKLIKAARCVIEKDPLNQRKLCKNKSVIKAATLLPLRSTLAQLEAQTISLSESEEKEVTNLANSLCCCNVNGTELASDNDGGAQTTGTTTTTTATGQDSGIGFWQIGTTFTIG